MSTNGNRTPKKPMKTVKPLSKAISGPILDRAEAFFSANEKKHTEALPGLKAGLDEAKRPFKKRKRSSPGPR